MTEERSLKILLWLVAVGFFMQTLRAFQATFICVGLITCAAAWIFWQLSPDVRGRGEEKAPADME